MADKAKRRTVASVKFVHTLAAQTGATPEEIRDIILLVGFDRASIFREVRDRQIESETSIEQTSTLNMKGPTRR